MIVLGVGTVQLRKGVDLFIECAARVVHAPDGNRCRFVWIGNGYDPDNDLGYSVYLADQVLVRAFSSMFYSLKKPPLSKPRMKKLTCYYFHHG